MKRVVLIREERFIVVYRLFWFYWLGLNGKISFKLLIISFKLLIKKKYVLYS